MKLDLQFDDIKINCMPQIELEKILNVIILRRSKGYNQFELSFLMGQRDFYVRDAENLTHTLIYAIPFNNIIRQIFDCDIQAIIPDLNKIPKYSIRISLAIDEIENDIYKVEKKIVDGKWIFLLSFSEEPKSLLLDSPSKFTQEEIQDWIDNKFQSGYFKKPKNALEVLKECQNDLDGAVRPLHISYALQVYTKKRMSPRLIKAKNENGRFEYIED